MGDWSGIGSGREADHYGQWSVTASSFSNGRLVAKQRAKLCAVGGSSVNTHTRYCEAEERRARGQVGVVNHLQDRCDMLGDGN